MVGASLGHLTTIYRDSVIKLDQLNNQTPLNLDNGMAIEPPKAYAFFKTMMHLFLLWDFR